MKNCKIKRKALTREEVIKAYKNGSLIKQYEEMIYGLAWKMSTQHQENFDELVSEGFFGIVRYIERFDPARSNLNTWVYKCAWDQMKTFCLTSPTRRFVPTDLEDPAKPYLNVPAKENWIAKLLSELSEEASTLVRVALEAPEELHEALRSRAPSTSAKALKTYMIDALDWTPEKVDQIWREVELCLS